MKLTRLAGALAMVAMSVSAALGQEPGTPSASSTGMQGNAMPQLQPLIMTKVPHPKHPNDAHGMSGWVRVECMVKPNGLTEGCRVLESEPAFVFDEAALIAMKEVRFKPFDSREPRLMVQRIIFRSD